MLLGPGRWGSEMPELGVPVSSTEISAATALCEIGAMHESLAPDLSLGTHFFNTIVEMNMVYIGLCRGREHNVLDSQWLGQAANRLAELAPDASQWCQVVRVVEAGATEKFVFWADHLQQQALLYRDGA
jgi:pyruvate,water dikinase